MPSLCKMSMTIIITINGKPPEAHVSTCVDTCGHTHANTHKSTKTKKANQL